MDKRELDRTEEMLHRSLKELNDKGEYNNASIDIIGKVIDALKDIHMIKEEENTSYGRGGWLRLRNDNYHSLHNRFNGISFSLSSPNTSWLRLSS